ncbi:MAG: nuclear transport factor 2 family protein [Terracidiphilus sp.]|jgi:ribonuclease HI
MEEQTEDEVRAYLIACERALLDPAVRRDRAQVEALLADDFLEFGSSVRVWDRQTILDSLASEEQSLLDAEKMHCVLISAEVGLVTYRAIRTDSAGTQSVTLRSSIWIKEAGKWRVRFHQGTRAAREVE